MFRLTGLPIAVFICLITSSLMSLPVVADDADAAATPTERETRLADYLNQCKFVGQFTVDGRETRNGKPEAYTISKCEKLPAKDMYRMTAKIVYGKTDAEVPLDLKILFAGGTPVITLDNLWIPGMGTFSSRVMIHDGRYTGTWQHGDKGGHMFGKIEQIESDKDEPATP